MNHSVVARHTEKILVDLGAILHNVHVVGNSGKHLEDYVNCDRVFPHPVDMWKLSGYLFDPFSNENIDVVVGPAMGGAVLAVMVAQYAAFTCGFCTIKCAWPDKGPDKSFVFEREGFADLLDGANVLLVEDVSTTPTGSASRVARLVGEHGGNVIGLSLIVNRTGLGDRTAEAMGVPRVHSLLHADYPAYTPSECDKYGPCSRGQLVDRLRGHGEQWANENPAHPSARVAV